MKNALGMRTADVHKIPCKCGLSYIAQTGRTVENCCEEHKCCIQLYYRDMTA